MEDHPEAGMGQRSDAAHQFEGRGASRRVPLRVLIFGRDDESRRPLVGALASVGMQVLEAADVEHAIALATGCEPDIVLMDRVVPSDDLKWTKRLISEAGVGHRVIMLSSLDDPRDQRTAMRTGIAEYLVKPVGPVQLVSAIHMVAARSRRGHPNSATVTEEPASDESFREIANALVDAFNRRDRAAWVGLFHPDVEFRPTLLIGARQTYRGREEVGAYLDRVAAAGMRQQARIREIRRVARGRFALLTNVVVDDEVQSPSVVLIRVDAEKIIEATAFLADAETLEALQMIPEV
jgi:DNA-binding NarL/FixJ family response regulator